MKPPLALRAFRDYAPPLIIAGYFIFITVFVSAAGNFPLNDDWSYGEGVRTFLETGRFELPTVCAPGFLHVILGAVSCTLFGYSYVTMRGYSLVVGALGAIFLYLSLKEIDVNRKAATFISLVYATTPLMVNIYFSFMSDVTALSLTNLYFYLLLRGIKRNSPAAACLSSVVFLAAISVRQSIVIFLPCSLGLLALGSQHRRLKWCLLSATAILSVAAYISVDHWLLNRRSFVCHYEWAKGCHLVLWQKLLSQPLVSLHDVIVALGRTTCYVGLFSLPALLPFLLQARKLWQKQRNSIIFCLLLSATISTVSIMQLVLHEGKSMPFDQNILCLPPVGAKGILGVEMPPLSHAQQNWFTGISYLAGLTLVTICSATIFYLWAPDTQHQVIAATPEKQHRRSVRLAMSWICAVSFLSSIFYSTVEIMIRSYERYYLIALVPCLMCLSLAAGRLRIRLPGTIATISLVFIAAYGALAGQDYLNWNRARWVALTRLEQQGIHPNEIDGGAEYNLLHDIKLLAAMDRGIPPRNEWRWWPIHGENYIISFDPLEGYETIDRVPYWNSLVFSSKDILVLKKIGNRLPAKTPAETAK